MEGNFHFIRRKVNLLTTEDTEAHGGKLRKLKKEWETNKPIGCDT
jgi:hypothetical protein